MKKLICLIAFVFLAMNVYAVSDLPLPDEVCAEIFVKECTESQNNAKFVDLNSDGVNELVVSTSGGSCGSQYYVFKNNKKLKWQKIGNWCGCGDGIATISQSKHHGFRDIKTCGVSGFFDGKSYMGVRQ